MCCYSSSCRPSGFLSWMASWLAFPLCPIVSAPLAAISLIRSVRSGSAYAMTRSALLSPFVVVTMCVTVRTAADYSHGKAVWHQMPKCCLTQCAPSTTIGWSVDPKTRMSVDPQRPHGHQIYTWRVSNRVGKALVKMFGVQKGAWAGVLPTPEDAGLALAAGRNVNARDLRGDPALAAAFGYPEWKGGFVGVQLGAVSLPIAYAGGERRQDLRIASMNGVDVVGTGPGFFVVLDPFNHREVARYGEPSR
jgi:hypothetical protein